MFDVGAVGLKGNERFNLEIASLPFRRQRRRLLYRSASQPRRASGRDQNRRLVLARQGRALVRPYFRPPLSMGEDAGDEGVGRVGVVAVAATAVRAASNGAGNALPRFSARRRIP